MSLIRVYIKSLVLTQTKFKTYSGTMFIDLLSYFSKMGCLLRIFGLGPVDDHKGDKAGVVGLTDYVTAIVVYYRLWMLHNLRFIRLVFRFE